MKPFACFCHQTNRLFKIKILINTDPLKPKNTIKNEKNEHEN